MGWASFLHLFYWGALLCAHSVSQLDHKLELQWHRFEEAKRFARKSASAGAVSIPRENWEVLLRINPSLKPNELNELRWRHRARIAKAKKKNRRLSLLDLDWLRSQGSYAVAKFCSELPKGGMLHIHAWGSLGERGLVRMLEQENPALKPGAFKSLMSGSGQQGFLYAEELNVLQKIHDSYGETVRYLQLSPRDQWRFRELFFLPAGANPWGRFEACFAFIGHLFDSKQKAKISSVLYEDFFERANAERVSYTEINAGGSLQGSVIRSAIEMAKRFHVVFRMQAGFDRVVAPSLTRKQIENLLRVPPFLLLVAINQHGDESQKNMLEAGVALYPPVVSAVEMGHSRLHLTAHAGEFGDERDPRDALLLGAERLGHAVALARDTLTLEYASKKRLPIETSLTSNLRLGVVKTMKEHPFLDYLRLGLPVSLSTDDEGIFRTDINQECALAIGKTDISYYELKELVLNSIRTSFIQAEEKTRLLARLTSELEIFEKRWAKFASFPFARKQVR